MAKQTINIGSTANDGTGDPLRTAFNKTNENFTEIYDIASSAFAQANSVYLPSVTRLNVTNSGASAYLFDQYSGNNPTIKITAGETIAFDLNVTGHPFMIRESSGGTNYNTGLTHVSSNGTITTDASAQGKVSGTLYWKVPAILAGNNYVYQCQVHSGMVGVFEIKESNGNPFDQNLNTSNNVTFNEVTSESLIVSGSSKLAKVVEPFSDIADATGVVTHDCTNNHIFYHTSLDANFTANFTNLSLANGEATSLTLVLDQGGTAYIANNVQIGGAAQTIKWSANTVPTGNTNAVDVQSFSVLRVSGNYIVLGQLSTFG